jgi:hypothetical protein
MDFTQQMTSLPTIPPRPIGHTAQACEDFATSLPRSHLVERQCTIK